MFETKIKMAGHTIRVQSLFPETGDFLKEYHTEAEPEFDVVTEKEDIEYERRKSEAEDKKEGIPIRHFTDEYLETLAVYRRIAEQMLSYDTILFHGSVIAVDGEGYLFTAKSGTGKSTHTRLWRENFGDRAVMVNDDKPLLRITKAGVIAYGTPWDGKHRLSSNISVPLKGICILERAAENHIIKIDTKEQLRSAYPINEHQIHRAGNPASVGKTQEQKDRLKDAVPIYRLSCYMERSAAKVDYEGMQNE